MSTTDIPLDRLFDKYRFPGKTVQVLGLALYLPLGICIILLRLFIALHALLVSVLLPKSWLLRAWSLRVMCCVLGIGVRESSTKLKDSQAKVLVSNHVTTVDHIVVDLVRPCVVPSVWDLPTYFNWGFIYKDFRKEGTFMDNINAFLETETNLCLLSMPEGATTTGRDGLLAFTDQWAFNMADVNTNIQPISISLYRPGFSFVAPTILESTWWTDILWLFFTPFTLFNINYLPSTTRLNEESGEDFAVRVQGLIAADLGIVATKHTSRDRDELRKRVATDRRQRQQQALKPRGSAAQRGMALQIKEVFPHIPLHVIERDLRETGNMDVTITRFLEGVVPFVPEPVPQTQQPEPKLTSSLVSTTSSSLASSSSSSVTRAALSTPTNVTSNPISLYTAASSFSKSAHERSLSLQERKALLLENARMRYLAKHSGGGGTV